MLVLLKILSILRTTGLWPASDVLEILTTLESFFQNNGSLFTNITYGGICPAGYYCLIGTKRPYEYPCPNGTYSNRTGLEREDQCIACDPGRSCTGEGLTEANGICKAGYYCVRGAKTPQPRDGVTGNICPAGYHCPTGSATFKQCVPGTYRYVRYISSFGLLNLSKFETLRQWDWKRARDVFRPQKGLETLRWLWKKVIYWKLISHTRAWHTYGIC